MFPEEGTIKSFIIKKQLYQKSDLILIGHTFSQKLFTRYCKTPPIPQISN